MTAFDERVVERRWEVVVGSGTAGTSRSSSLRRDDVEVVGAGEALEGGYAAPARVSRVMSAWRLVSSARRLTSASRSAAWSVVRFLLGGGEVEDAWRATVVVGMPRIVSCSSGAMNPLGEEESRLGGRCLVRAVTLMGPGRRGRMRWSSAAERWLEDGVRGPRRADGGHDACRVASLRARYPDRVHAAVDRAEPSGPASATRSPARSTPHSASSCLRATRPCWRAASRAMTCIRREVTLTT